MGSMLSRHFFIRNRNLMRGIFVILVIAMGSLYMAYKVDIFPNEDPRVVHAATVELDEALLVAAITTMSIFVFGWIQYAAQRREMAARIAAEQRIRELAYQDGLTGLPNRRQYEEALNAAVASPPRAGASHAIFLLDLNGFKHINDVHGHAEGDRSLVTVAQRLRAAMRDGDLIARFGGDEFAILATHLGGAEAATSVALRVIEALEPPIETSTAVHNLGVGIGICLVPSDASTSEEALRKADVALYRAKAERRSALRFFESAMDIRVRERTSMEQALRMAMARGDIKTVYQPTVSLLSRKITGFDVSPQWVDPELGQVELERFIALAEEVGLIHALAERVLRQAVEAAQSWPSHVIISVDIYPSQLKDQLLPSRMLKILEEAGIPASRLEVQITESALVGDMSNAQSILGALRSSGVQIALDNFGTGYSSLYHLRNVKLDKIKIDRSFIDTMATEPASAGIVNALVGLANGLGLTIAAEGVEASNQEGLLLRSGCEQGQGGLFSSPISATEALNLFASDATTSLYVRPRKGAR
jgi:diguanylate cyclase (GGDEF)-like protein